jgi:hypothetical protein
MRAKMERRRTAMPRPLIPALGLILILVAVAPAFAAGPLAVDVVSIKGGRPLRGAVLGRDSDGMVTMAVSRAWLEKADPQEFTRQSELLDNEQRAAWTETLERIETRLENPPEEQRFVFLLKEERDRLQRQLDAKQPVEPDFLLMKIPANRIAKLTIAPLDRQLLALLAWDAGFTKVETRSAAEIRKDLMQANIPLEGPAPDLSSRVPARRQSDAEWQARLAIAEYAYSETPLDFQGMGDALVRTGDGKPIDVAAILPKLLTSQVDSLLSDLLEPGLKAQPLATPDKSSLRSAVAVAEKEHRRGFRVTRLDINAQRMAVTVETEFVVRGDDGEWRAIWKAVETADGRQARAAEEARIAEDPQVRGALKSLGGLGLGTEDALRQAIRIGAATMSAQQACDARFFEFRDRYLRRLDGPPLPVK